MRRSRRSDVLAYWILGSMPQTVHPDFRISAVAICQHVRCPRTRICVKSDVQRARYGTEEREHLTSEKGQRFANRTGQKSYLERAMGLEPTALCLGSRCSTAELRPLGAPAAWPRASILPEPGGRLTDTRGDNIESLA